YQLAGIDRDWGAPSFERTVNYPNLPAGTYRFAVRALNAEGVASEPPALLAFTIRRPVLQRWGFVALTLGVLRGLAYAAYRYRLAQLLALERMRTRIATDLHDDIGANLTKISILSEVAKQQYAVPSGENGGLQPLTAIADISRESVAVMSDIVWAINP